MRRPTPHVSIRPTPSRLALSLLMACLCLDAMAPAQADSQVTLTGKVTAGTCVVNHPSVAWEDISAADIPEGGRVTASTRRFDIELSSCAGVTAATFTFGSMADADPVEADTFRNTATSPAPYLSIWIQRANAIGACPSSGSTQKPGTTHNVLVDSDAITVPMCATYYQRRDGRITAGDVHAAIVLGIAYN